MAEYNLKKDEFYQWKMDPVGQEVFRMISDVRQKWVEELATTPNANVSLYQGVIRGLDMVLNLEVD